MTTVVAVAVILRYLFHTRYGLINFGLGHLGIGPIDWLGDPHWSMPAIVLFAVWKNFGYNMIILLAGLQGIPQDLYEAARIDGAGRWAQFRHITLPSLQPMLLLVGIITIAGYFQLFAEPYVMTRGDPLQIDRQRALLHVRGRLQVVEPRPRLRDRVHPVRAHSRRHARAAARDARARGAGMNVGANARGARWIVNGLLIAGAAFALFPLLWMLSVSFMQPGEASHVSAAAAAGACDAGELSRPVRRAGMGHYLFNSLLVATAVTLLSLAFNLSAGYAFAKLQFARPRAPVPASARAR